jgi:hypothetical protein
VCKFLGKKIYNILQMTFLVLIDMIIAQLGLFCLYSRRSVKRLTLCKFKANQLNSKDLDIIIPFIGLLTFFKIINKAQFFTCLRILNIKANRVNENYKKVFLFIGLLLYFIITIWSSSILSFSLSISNINQCIRLSLKFLYLTIMFLPYTLYFLLISALYSFLLAISTGDLGYYINSSPELIELLTEFQVVYAMENDPAYDNGFMSHICNSECSLGVGGISGHFLHMRRLTPTPPRPHSPFGGPGPSGPGNGGGSGNGGGNTEGPSHTHSGGRNKRKRMHNASFRREVPILNTFPEYNLTETIRENEIISKASDVNIFQNDLILTNKIRDDLTNRIWTKPSHIEMFNETTTAFDKLIAVINTRDYRMVYDGTRTKFIFTLRPGIQSWTASSYSTDARGFLEYEAWNRWVEYKEVFAKLQKVGMEDYFDNLQDNLGQTYTRRSKIAAFLDNHETLHIQIHEFFKNPIYRLKCKIHDQFKNS